MIATWPILSQFFKLKSFNLAPVASCAAILASGVLVALLTNGVVLLARGLTSSTYTFPSLNANCKFINPTTLSSKAKSVVIFEICFMAFDEILYGGKTQAESPEWIPASSICCMIAPICTFLPSHKASTSNSKASSRNWSINIGCPAVTSAFFDI